MLFLNPEATENMFHRIDSLPLKSFVYMVLALFRHACYALKRPDLAPVLEC
jgi:hypothetical protein